MQAILTHYLLPTDSRPARVKARTAAGALTKTWDYAKNPEQNHIAAAQALAETLGWLPIAGRGLVSGQLADGSFAHLLMDQAPAQPTTSGLSAIAALADELAELRDWKQSQLAVETERDAQAVAALLGIQKGSSIRAGIEPAVKRLIAERDALRAELVALHAQEPAATVPVGWAVESSAHPGSVQIYPEQALEIVEREGGAV